MQRISGQRAWRRIYKTVTVPAPSAGADWRATVPAGELWRILSLYASLVTSAVVANRFTELTVGDGVSTYLVIPTQAAQTASGTQRYGWWGPNNNGPTNNANRIAIPELVLQPGETIGPVTSGIDVGDQWGAAFIRVEATTWKRGPVDLDDLDIASVVIVNPPE